MMKASQWDILMVKLWAVYLEVKMESHLVMVLDKI